MTGDLPAYAVLAALFLSGLLAAVVVVAAGIVVGLGYLRRRMPNETPICAGGSVGGWWEP